MRNMNTRRTALLLLMAILFLLQGCGTSSQLSASLEQRKITLTFRHFWVNEHDKPVAAIFEDVIRSFEEKHPHIKIDFEGIDQTFHREQKLKSEMVTGNPPDIFSLFGGAEIEPYVNAKRLLDLRPFLQADQLEQEFKDLSLWTFSDGVYGLPFEGFAEPIYYNKEIFQQLQLQPPETWEDTLRTIQVLKENGYIPFALGNDERWPAAIYYHYFLHRQGGVERINGIVSGTDSFLNPEYLLATELFLQFADTLPFTDAMNAKSKEFAEKQFMEGQAAMYMNGSWVINVLQGELSPPGFKNQVGIINFPIFNKGTSEKNGITGGYTIGLGLSANLQGDRLEAAFDLLREIYKPDIQERLVYEALRLPSMNIQVDEEKVGPVFAQLVDLIPQVPGSFIPYDNTLPPAVQETFFNVTQDLIDRKLSAEEALSKLQQAIEQYREVIRKGGLTDGKPLSDSAG